MSDPSLQTQILELSLRLTQMQVSFMERQNALANSMSQLAEDVEKKIAFIIDQQASFSVNIDRLQDNMGKLQDNVEKLQEAHVRTDRRLESLASKIETMIDAQAQTAKDLSTLAKAQARTNAQVDTVSERVTELIGKLSNGKPKL